MLRNFLRMVLGAFKAWSEKVFWQPVAQMRLRRGHVYPTLAGAVFFVVALGIVAFAINFSSKNGYLFGFAIASLLITSIPLAFMNMANLDVAAVGCEPVFAGASARFKFEISNQSRFGRNSIGVRAAGEKGSCVIVDVASRSRAIVEIVVAAKSRGTLPSPLIIFETRFPFGLFCVRVNWMPLATCTVWPAPEPEAPLFCEGGVRDGGAARSDNSEQSNFAGVRDFQAGDSLSGIAWLQMAKRNLLESDKHLTKIFDSSSGGGRFFSHEHVADIASIESKLSRLSGWICEADFEGVEYSLILGRRCIEIGRGEAHKGECLSLLALSQLEDFS